MALWRRNARDGGRGGYQKLIQVERNAANQIRTKCILIHSEHGNEMICNKKSQVEKQMKCQLRFWRAGQLTQ
jgi:hypothetical protein